MSRRQVAREAGRRREASDAPPGVPPSFTHSQFLAFSASSTERHCVQPPPGPRLRHVPAAQNMARDPAHTGRDHPDRNTRESTRSELATYFTAPGAVPGRSPRLARGMLARRVRMNALPYEVKRAH